MKIPHVLFVAGTVAAVAAGLAPRVARCDINGFGDFSNFTANKTDGGSSPTISGGTIELTSGGDELRSIFCNTPQNVSNFTASFIFQSSGQAGNYSGGCFVLQNSPAGVNAVGNSYGYGGINTQSGGIGNSIGIVLGSLDDTGYYTDGTVSGPTSTSPVNLLSGDPIDVTLNYTGGLVLQESLVDLTTSASYSNTYLLSAPIPEVVGGSTAYVGLTANSANGLDNPLNQSFGNLEFATAVPEPSTVALLAVGAACLALGIWRRKATGFRLSLRRA